MREKIADGALISKWRKPGYEILCSLLAIQKNNHNFGTTSHCRYVTTHIPPCMRAAVSIVMLLSCWWTFCTDACYRLT